MNKKCQVFTPKKTATSMLKSIGYINDIYNKKVLENSCGSGNFLKLIVEAYIKDCLKNEMQIENIRRGLERNIIGYDIDIKLVKLCKEKLSIIARNHGINDVEWQIKNEDYLKTSIGKKVDFIIGNPPYTKYNELDKETREHIRNNYISCQKGKFDLCYPFIEKGIDSLNSNGKLIYIIPNSIFKNVYAQNLREILLKGLTKISDYKKRKLFTGTLTSSAIITYEKGNSNKEIHYIDNDNKTKSIIKSNKLSGKWVFNNPICRKGELFGDYFYVANSVATLRNNIFILKGLQKQNDKYFLGDYKFEEDSLRPAASPRGMSLGWSEYIVFPYFYYSDGKLQRFSEEQFKEKYPNTYNYLNLNKNELLKRDSDASAKWFEFGRSQAISHLYTRKLLLSTVVTKKVNVYDLDKNCIPYSGFYIYRKENIGLNVARKILESEDFLVYVTSLGINANSDSLRITVNDIKGYKFNLKNYIKAK